MGEDKAFTCLAGKPLIMHTHSRLQDQSSEIIISANTGQDQYQTLLPDSQIITDTVQPSRGPLEGILTALRYGQDKQHGSWLLSTTVDCPFIPLELGRRLMQLAAATSADCVISTSKGKRHYLSSLWKLNLRDKLDQHLLKGRYDVRSFLKTLSVAEVDFSDQPLDPFINVNTKDDLAHAELVLQSSEFGNT